MDRDVVRPLSGVPSDRLACHSVGATACDTAQQSEAVTCDVHHFSGSDVTRPKRSFGGLLDNRR